MKKQDVTQASKEKGLIMRKLLISTVTVLVALNLWQCSGNPTEPNAQPEPRRELDVVEKQLVESSDQFGLKLFQNVAAVEDGNLFMSPLSVSLALGMTCNGAAGETQTDMQQTLELIGLTQEQVNQSYRTLMDLLTNLDPKVTFEIANSIWTREGFPVRQEFFDVNQTYFDAETRQLDFAHPDAAAIINGWVDEKTHGKIPTILDPPLPPNAVFYLINAIYFKGDWALQFNSDQTIPLPFFLADGSEVMCDMMRIQEDFDYYDNDLFQAIDLAYGDGDFSMTVLLPKSNDLANATSELITRMSTDNWDSWTTDWQTREVALFLPKFELEYEIKLNDVLAAMGMEVAFDTGRADFSNITEAVDLYIDMVKHKAFVKVDEEGTVAAAVTVVGGATSIGPSEVIYMDVNRPFVFAIRDRVSGTILFIGRVNDPT